MSEEKEIMEQAKDEDEDEGETLGDLGLWKDEDPKSDSELPKAAISQETVESYTAREEQQQEEAELVGDIGESAEKVYDVIPSDELVNEELVEIEKQESRGSLSRDATTHSSLSFEDPRFFQLDEILGPDQEIEARQRQGSKGKKKHKSKLPFPEITSPSFSGSSNRSSFEDQDDQSEHGSGEEADSDYTSTPPPKSRESNATYPGEMPGEQEPDMAEPGKEAPEVKDSLQDFEQLYMKLSDTCAMAQLSDEVLRMPSRQPTPSPPGTPELSTYARPCPSIESFFKLSEKVRIHFHVLPGRKIYSKDVRLDRTFGQIKDELAQIVKIPARFIELRRNKNLVMDYKTLKDVGGKPGKKLRFTIEVNKRAQGFWELKIPEENKLDKSPDVIRGVRIYNNRIVNVTIEFAQERKLFIGGYKNKVKGSEHHHATTQTPFLRKALRETQTHKCTQAFREAVGCSQTMVTTYTQVDRPDYFVSCQNQKLLVAKTYKSSCRWDMIRQRAAITIQKYWRRWLAIKERDDRMEGLIKRVEWAELVRKGRTETRLAIKDDELYRQYNPTTLLDIELLYRAINIWRKQEVDYVLANRWGAEKKAALADIMEKEADLLLDLERAKSKIMDAKNSYLVEDLYKKMGAPTRWLTRTGQFITLDTPEKEKARQHHDMYHQLEQPVTSHETRLQLLDKLYKLIKDHRTVTSDYLVQLIGREITLMQRNARERLLIGLRKRILNGFFALCRDSTFNAEARTLQKVPFDVMKLRKDMVQCKGCRKMLYRDQFTISRGVTVTNRCLTCMGLYRTCILRVDLNLYRRMLQELRQDEQEQGVESSISYLIDAYDLQFLIEKLWHGQSALSGIDDRYLLRLCRWLKNKPWTPWNCVLLTEEEAVAHLHIDDMTIAYQQSFFEKVRLRHNAARSYFARTGKTSLGLDTNLQMYCMAKESNSKLRRKNTLKKRVFSTVSTRASSMRMPL